MLTAIGALILVGSGLISGHRLDVFLLRLGYRPPVDLFAALGTIAGVAMAWQLPW